MDGMEEDEAEIEFVSPRASRSGPRPHAMPQRPMQPQRPRGTASGRQDASQAKGQSEVRRPAPPTRSAPSTGGAGVSEVPDADGGRTLEQLRERHEQQLRQDMPSAAKFRAYSVELVRALKKVRSQLARQSEGQGTDPLAPLRSILEPAMDAVGFVPKDTFLRALDATGVALTGPKRDLLAYHFAYEDEEHVCAADLLDGVQGTLPFVQQAVKAQLEASQQAEPCPVGPLPSNWRWKRDAEGSIYFIDVASMTTQWEHPVSGKVYRTAGAGGKGGTRGGRRK